MLKSSRPEPLFKTSISMIKYQSTDFAKWVVSITFLQYIDLAIIFFCITDMWTHIYEKMYNGSSLSAGDILQGPRNGCLKPTLNRYLLFAMHTYNFLLVKQA